MVPAEKPSLPIRDVRMRGFAKRSTVDEALCWIDHHVAALTSDNVSLNDAAGRVLAEDMISKVDVPSFRRAMMDGYAVQAHDTLGATPYNSLQLTVVGEALPGRPFDGSMEANQAVRIMTGAPLPDGADAVLPVEKTQSAQGLVLVQDEVPPQKHVGYPGEDIQSGTTVLKAFRRLRPQDLGVLSSIGISAVPVVRKPRINLIVTGDELLPPGSSPTPCHTVDSNSPMITALVKRDGGDVQTDGILADDPDVILTAMRQPSDVILVSGGSSVGQEDHAPRLVQHHGELAIHGITIRPSSPAGMGSVDGKLIFLLPGNPVSCLCAYDFFAGRAIRGLAGLSLDWPYQATHLTLARKLVSAIGRTDYARVAIVHGQVEPIATSGASVLSSTTRADGFVVVPADSEGYAEGATVEVWLYD